MKDKVQVIVVENNEPISPLLVPVTIQWVEADRAYQTTLQLVTGSLWGIALLTAAGASTTFTLSSLMVFLVTQTAVRYYFRVQSYKALDAMKKQIVR